MLNQRIIGKMFLLIAGVLLITHSLGAEDWIDSSPRSDLGRGVETSWYNPALASRWPWEKPMARRSQFDKTRRLEFGFSSSFTFAMVGRGYRDLLSLKGEYEVVRDRFDEINLDPYNSDYDPMTGEVEVARNFVDLLHFANRLEDARGSITKGDGIYMSYSYGFSSRITDLFEVRDALSIGVRTYGSMGMAPVLELPDPTKYRLFDITGLLWVNFLEQYAIYLPPPKTIPGKHFASQLVDMGYPQSIADAIARLLEDHDFQFGTYGEELALAYLYNNLHDIGDSFESGANPFAGNKSRLLNRATIFNEISVGYSFGLWDWVSLGATIKYIQANRSYSETRLTKVPGPNAAFRRFTSPIEDFLMFRTNDARRNIGLDLGIALTVPNNIMDVVITLAGRNINSPAFKWKDAVLKLTPQFRLGMSGTFLARYAPIIISFDIDLNREASSVLPGYYLQYTSLGLAFKPDFENWGLSIGLGATRNIGDDHEPWKFKANIGFRLWVFNLDIGGHTTFDSVPLIDWALPSRFGLYGTLGFKVDW